MSAMRRYRRADIFLMALLLAVVSMPSLSLARAATLFDINSNGYLRAGPGYTKGGDDNTCFQAPAAAAKYRLGNECEFYAEVGFEVFWRPQETAESPYIKAEVMANILADDDASDLELLGFPQVYIEIGQALAAAPDSTIWLGKRYYRRHDVHINDFYYLSISGTGLGIQDLPLAQGKFAYALIGGEKDKLFEDSKLYQYNHDLRWYDLPLNIFGQQGGRMMFWLDYAKVPRNKDGALRYQAGDGLAVGVQHHQADILGQGYNKFSLQYGRALMSKLAPAGDLLVQSGAAAMARERARTVRVVNQTLLEKTRYSFFTSLIWQQEDDGRPGRSKITWRSIGLRPQYYFSDKINLAVEVGADHVDDQPAARSGTLYKATIAPQLTTARGFWNRPVLRAYYTYAWWSDEFEGDIGSPIYANQTSGSSFGIQIESWW